MTWCPYLSMHLGEHSYQVLGFSSSLAVCDQVLETYHFSPCLSFGPSGLKSYSSQQRVPTSLDDHSKLDEMRLDTGMNGLDHGLMAPWLVIICAT